MANDCGPLLITDEFINDFIERLQRASHTATGPTGQALQIVSSALETVLKEHQKKWYGK